MAPVKKDYPPLQKTFFAEWRESHGLTQEEAADKINISRSTLSKIETGDSIYTQRTLEEAARAYKCQPSDLLIRAPDDTSGRGYLISLLLRAPESQFEYLRGALEASVGGAKKAS